MTIAKLLPEVKTNIPLKKYTTFKIGGPAKYFFVAKNKEDLIKAVILAKKLKLPFFILGGGSNILVSDKGFNGLVIKIQNSKFKIQNENSKFKIFCESGIPLAKLVSQSLKIGATGLEWAVGIPGTVGGAVYGNAGAFGGSMEDVVEEVEVFDSKELRFKIYDLRDCQFGYRDSIFKHNKNLIILSVTLRLKKGNKKEIKNKVKKNLETRKKTQPLIFPSAGSIFKNPPGKSAGELIEKSELKGKRVGKVKISEKHANFIVNLGHGKAEDVKKLIKLIKKEVKKKFGVTLKEEIQFL
jgi:UDP-N-acetylmuramate dehydrogenase